MSQETDRTVRERNDDDRFRLVEAMREAQRQYFRTRSPQAHQMAMDLERDVDEMLKRRKRGASLYHDDG